MPADLFIRGGTVIDGTGSAGRPADVAIADDRIVAVGNLEDAPGIPHLDATGMVVAPGFINVLSQAWASIQRDPTAGSDLLQGVTTEVFGEGLSLGPGGQRLAAEAAALGAGEDVRIDFDRLSDGLAYLEERGTSVNVASLIGGSNLRLIGAGYQAGPLDPTQLDRTRAIVEEEMSDGALGVGTALIYAPGSFAGTDELVALCEVVGRHDGIYMSHLRSEGDNLLDGIEELIDISRRAQCRADVYHLKAAGRDNWPKMTTAIERLAAARDAGTPVAANMYPYTAGATSLAAAIPPSFHVGGPAALLERLANSRQRAEIAADIRSTGSGFENLYLGAGGGAGIVFFDDLEDGTPARGRSLAEVAHTLGMDDVDALIELVTREPTRMVAYFVVDELNVHLGLQQPWVSIGSDGEAHRAIPPFTGSATHPRTYGTFARFLGRYCRDQELVQLPEAVRRLTSLPADRLGLRGRGRVVPGAFADFVVFDPTTVADRSTYSEPHQYAVGIAHVLVNGTPTVIDGTITSARPGRRLRRGR